MLRGNLNLVRIAEVFEIAENDNQHDANARLISAAPELLEALEEAVYADYETVTSKGIEIHDMPWLIKAISVIKKAKGE